MAGRHIWKSVSTKRLECWHFSFSCARRDSADFCLRICVSRLLIVVLCTRIIVVIDSLVYYKIIFEIFPISILETVCAAMKERCLSIPLTTRILQSRILDHQTFIKVRQRLYCCHVNVFYLIWQVNYMLDVPKNASHLFFLKLSGISMLTVICSPEG